MAASPPLVTSDILHPEASALRINDSREGIASVISTIRAQIADRPAEAMRSVGQPPAAANAMMGGAPPVRVLAPAASPPKVVPSPLARSASASTNASNGVAADATERGPNHSHPQVVSPPLSGQNQHGIAPKSAAGEEKTKAYETLMDLVQNTDASVVRQVVRENWHKCLIGSDYHCGFIANAAISYSSPAVLSRTVQELGEKLLASSKRDLAKHLRGEDLDEIADLIGPKLGIQFQDRVMATRLETIAAQDLINALARAERLGYHINDVVKKKPGPGGETVIPSISALLTSLPPMPPNQIHTVVSHPPPMPPHLGPGPQQRPQPPQQQSQHPQQPQYPSQQPQRVSQGQHPIPIMLNGNITFSSPSQSPTAAISTMSQPIPNQTIGIMYCETCRRPCSSSDALNYHTKKAKCQNPKPSGTIGVDTCVHCGCQFESPGGLAYHTKSNVCGHHSEETRLHVMELLRQREVLLKMAPSQPSNNHGAPNYQVAPGQPANSVPAVVKSNATPNRRPVSSAATPSPSTNDPYAKLSPEQRMKFNAEMKGVDDFYGGLMREAEKLPPGKREEELAKLKNRYNTKQSNTRKKYGIRLRERRANVDADRSWNTNSAEYAHSAKKARADDGQARPSATQVMESPRRRVPVSEMGGLSASSATAELVDPTASSANSRPPPPGYRHPAPPIRGAPPGTYRGTHNDPMEVDDDASTGTDSDNVDIPARIRSG
ncbi:hypothetical protein V8C35DRAFT_279061 [Trichoderma chlorosporum]